MYFVWKKKRFLYGVFADKQQAFDVGITYGASYITEQVDSRSPPTHWWFL